MIFNESMRWEVEYNNIMKVRHGSLKLTRMRVTLAFLSGSP